jgi:hypothetical protein
MADSPTKAERVKMTLIFKKKERTSQRTMGMCEKDPEPTSRASHGQNQK